MVHLHCCIGDRLRIITLEKYPSIERSIHLKTNSQYMPRSANYSGYTLRSPIEAPLITREVLPETYFLLVIMAADAQAGPFLEFQASC